MQVLIVYNNCWLRINSKGYNLGLKKMNDLQNFVLQSRLLRLVKFIVRIVVRPLYHLFTCVRSFAKCCNKF